MNYLDLTIKDIHSDLANKEVKVSDLVKEALSRAKENKDRHSALANKEVKAESISLIVKSK